MMQYQPHIDGLRSIAVLSVIFFHLDIDFLKGGYVGVDIFFVISGYLITSIIVKEIASSGQFSFSKFYVRRARRLLPAFFVTLILCTIFAVTLFTSDQLNDFSSELIYSTFSLANIHFWLQSGYFDGNADTKVLLHMWSLSVEEQFYLLWPLTLVLLFKHLSVKKIFLVGLTIFSVSLILNIYLINVEVEGILNQSSMIFYITPFRAYEFLLGASGVWLVRRIPQNKLIHEFFFVAGMVAIVLAITQFSPGIPFPYYFALLPCLGALFLILAKESALSRFVLENRLMVYIGLLSYTLYLVHWPVIVFLKNYRLADITPFYICIALIVTYVITLAIHHLVEKPFRIQRKIKNIANNEGANLQPNRKFLQGCIAATVLIASIGIGLAASSGLYQFKSELFSEEVITKGKASRYDLIRKACRITDLSSDSCHNERPLQVLIIGNSHEPDGYNIFHTMFGDSDKVNLVLFGGTNYCVVILTSEGVSSQIKRNDCNNQVAKLNDKVFVNSLDIIILASNKPSSPNMADTWKLLRYLQTANESVELLLLGGYLNTVRNCADIANRHGDTDACKRSELLGYMPDAELELIRQSEMSNGIEFTYINKYRALCIDGNIQSCLTRSEYEPMFYDQSHLSLSFSRLVGRRLLSEYSNIFVDLGFLGKESLPQ